MTKGRKNLLLIVMIGISVALLSACADFGYTFHYSVTGENVMILPVLGWEISPIRLMGGRKGQQLKFTAIHDEVYRVNQRTFNCTVVERN